MKQRVRLCACAKLVVMKLGKILLQCWQEATGTVYIHVRSSILSCILWIHWCWKCIWCLVALLLSVVYVLQLQQVCEVNYCLLMCISVVAFFFPCVGVCARSEVDDQRMTRCLIQELATLIKLSGIKTVTSVYFGGGRMYLNRHAVCCLQQFWLYR